MPKRIREVPSHPCEICEAPTTNPAVCGRSCAMKLNRQKSPAIIPGPRPDRRRSPQERYHLYVPQDPPENECWQWYGTTTKNGYPTIWDTESNRQINAVRVSWEVHRGKIPKDHVVSPVCENRLCTNPKHLVCGPRGEIVGRRLRLNRKTARYGDNNPSSRLTDAETAKVRELHSEGRFIEIHAIAKEKEMSGEYLISVGRSRGRKRKPNFKHYQSKAA